MNHFENSAINQYAANQPIGKFTRLWFERLHNDTLGLCGFSSRHKFLPGCVVPSHRNPAQSRL